MSGLGVQEGIKNLPPLKAGHSYRLFVGRPQGVIGLEGPIGIGKYEMSVNSLQPFSHFLMAATLVGELAPEVEAEQDRPVHPEDALYGNVLYTAPSQLAHKSPPRVRWIGRPTGHDIGRQLGPNDLFADLVPRPIAEIDEEEIHIHPTVGFGTRPIPRTSRRIRLTPRIRAAIPNQRLPRSFSLPLPESPED